MGTHTTIVVAGALGLLAGCSAAAAEFSDRVAFREVHTFERSAVAEWGEADAVYADGRAVQSGPPPVGEGGGSARPASLSLQGRASRRRRATAECRLPIPE